MDLFSAEVNGQTALRGMPLLLGVLCVLAIAYRYYSAFLAAKVATLVDLPSLGAQQRRELELVLSLFARDAEILIDQIRAFCQAADAQGADVRLTVWKNMTHVFQAFGDELGEAQEALADLGRFVRDRLERAARAPA